MESLWCSLLDLLAAGWSLVTSRPFYTGYTALILVLTALLCRIFRPSNDRDKAGCRTQRKKSDLTVHSWPQLLPSKVQCACCPHTTYYTNFFVLRMAVTINGLAAESRFSENNELTLNCHYSGTECGNVTFHSISSQLESVLKKYGVRHINNFWLGEFPFIQVGFSSDHSLKTFLHSRQEMQREIGLLLSSSLKERQPSIATEFPVEVETKLFLVLPDAENKIKAVSHDNCSHCLALWKESEKFDLETLFRTYPLNGKLSVKMLVSELTDVVDWFHLGLYLGVPHSELLIVAADHQRQTKQCKTEVLNWWVNNGDQPAWSGVVKALFGIGMRGLARKIAVEHNVALSTETERRALEALPLQIETEHSTASLVASLEKLRKENGKKSEELAQVREKLKQEKKNRIDIERKLFLSKEDLVSAHKKMTCLSIEIKETERKLSLKEKELFFLQQVGDKSNIDLESVIKNKEAEIANLKEELDRVNTELSQSREKIQELREQLQQITVELEKKSVQVQEMERARADMERERSRADMLAMQLCAMSQKMQFPLETVTPAEVDTLKQTVKKKEEEVERLSSQLEAKETEKQKLLTEMEKQSQHNAEELLQLIGELCELRSSLEKAEDAKMRAEVDLEDMKSRKSVIDQAPSTLWEGTPAELLDPLYQEKEEEEELGRLTSQLEAEETGKEGITSDTQRATGVMDSPPTSHRMLLIGEVGAGKTSFLNFLYNSGFVLADQNCKGMLDKICTINDTKLENPTAGPMQSKTSDTKLYPNVKLAGGLTVGIIDTPGFGDSRGITQDKQTTKRIIDVLKSVDFINCICLVINGSIARMNATLGYVLTEVTAFLPREILNNIIVVFTNTANQLDLNFDPAVFEHFWGKEIDPGRIFLINNPCCRVIKMQQERLENAEIERTLLRSFGEAREMLTDMSGVIKGFEQVYTHHFVAHYETMQKVEREVQDLLLKYDYQTSLEQQLSSVEEESKVALTKKKLNADYRSIYTVSRWVQKSTRKHNLLCGAQQCYSNCQIECTLPKSFDKAVLKQRQYFNHNDVCVNCGHHYTFHYTMMKFFMKRFQRRWRPLIMKQGADLKMLKAWKRGHKS